MEEGRGGEGNGWGGGKERREGEGGEGRDDRSCDLTFYIVSSILSLPLLGNRSNNAYTHTWVVSAFNM